MNIDSKRKHLLAQIEENLADLVNAMEALEYSERKCRVLAGKADYDLEEQERFEALTARFARAADILTQRALRTVFALLQEEARTKLDAANLAEKLGIVQDAEILLNIRELRNQISHEYVRDQLNTLFSDVLRYVPALQKIFTDLIAYCQRFN